MKTPRVSETSPRISETSPQSLRNQPPESQKPAPRISGPCACRYVRRCVRTTYDMGADARTRKPFNENLQRRARLIIHVLSFNWCSCSLETNSRLHQRQIETWGKDWNNRSATAQVSRAQIGSKLHKLEQLATFGSFKPQIGTVWGMRVKRWNAEKPQLHSDARLRSASRLSGFIRLRRIRSPTFPVQW